MADALPTTSSTVSVPLQLAVEALADVLVDYNVPGDRILVEFKQTVAVYMDMEAERCDTQDTTKSGPRCANSRAHGTRKVGS